MNGELHNVPPIWTALFHWQSCLLYVNLLPRRWGRGRSCPGTWSIGA